MSLSGISLKGNGYTSTGEKYFDFSLLLIERIFSSPIIFYGNLLSLSKFPMLTKLPVICLPFTMFS